MAEIPSGLGASAAQAGFQAQDVSKARDANSANRVDAANRRTQAVDQAASSVDTDDRDAQVFTDAEGAGSQGRQLDEDQTPDQTDDQSPPEPPGITRDEDGKLHLDLEA